MTSNQLQSTFKTCPRFCKPLTIAARVIEMHTNCCIRRRSVCIDTAAKPDAIVPHVMSAPTDEVWCRDRIIVGFYSTDVLSNLQGHRYQTVDDQTLLAFDSGVKIIPMSLDSCCPGDSPQTSGRRTFGPLSHRAKSQARPSKPLLCNGRH